MSTTSVGRLNKRHAILTGAGGGIGAAVAAAFLREGALCTIVDLAAQPSQAVQELARFGLDGLRRHALDAAQVQRVHGGQVFGLQQAPIQRRQGQ